MSRKIALMMYENLKEDFVKFGHEYVSGKLHGYILSLKVAEIITFNEFEKMIDEITNLELKNKGLI